MKRCIHVLLALTAFVLIVTSWTGASWAQAKIPRVGIILPTAPDQRFIGPFYQTLREHGWVEGKTVAFEVRDAGGDPTQLAGLAAELVRLKVDVLFPVGPPACAPPSRLAETFRSWLMTWKTTRWRRVTLRHTAGPGATSRGSSLTPPTLRASGSNCLRL